MRIFLLIQGYEWLRLIHFGLTISSSVYGGLFYTLIGCPWAPCFRRADLAFDSLWQWPERALFQKDFVGVQTCGMYWTFVVALMAGTLRLGLSFLSAVLLTGRNVKILFVACFMKSENSVCLFSCSAVMIVCRRTHQACSAVPSVSAAT